MASNNIYLITRPYNQALGLLEKCAGHNINAAYFPLFEIVPNLINEYDLNYKVAMFDNIFFSSPSTIELFTKQYSLPVDKTYYVPGISSANVLSTFTKNKIIYPVKSGVDGLIYEKLLINIKNILLIGGDSDNKILLEYLKLNKIVLDSIALYTRHVNLKESYKILLSFLNKYKISGIVISSSQLARLFLELYKINEQNLTSLYNCKFIASHVNIAKILIQKFPNVYTTSEPDNNSILELIKGF